GGDMRGRGRSARPPRGDHGGDRGVAARGARRADPLARFGRWGRPGGGPVLGAGSDRRGGGGGAGAGPAGAGSARRALPAGGAVQAVDLFWVRDRTEGVEAVARALPKLVRDLRAVLSGQVSPTELANKRRGGQRLERSSPKVHNQVAVDDRASPRQTVIEV